MALTRRERQRRARSRIVGSLAALVAAALLAGGVWWWLGRESGPDAPPSDPGAALETPPPDTAPPVDEELPELEESDAFVRNLVTRLSAQPQLAQWLAHEDLIRRFVLVVVDLAGRSNPAANVSFLRPTSAFEVQQEGDGLRIAPATHRRYDLLVTVFESLDTEGTVELYHRLYPLLSEAYGQLGIPDQSFHELLQLALRNLQSARIPEESPEVVDADGIYVFRDPELEDLRGADKALIRLGPENAGRVQAKAADLEEELERRGAPPEAAEPRRNESR